MRCEICGKRFIQKKKTQRNCSQDCSRKKARMVNIKPKIKQTCKICLVDFYMSPGKIREYCGLKCAAIGRGIGNIKPLQKRNCKWCRQEFLTQQCSTKQFCNQSCVSKWRNAQPEWKARHRTLEARKKASLMFKKMHKDNPNISKLSSEKMKANNPSRRQDIVEKIKAIKATKRINETLHVWKGECGGNGILTKEQQQLLAISLGWPTEVAISLGK